MNLLLFILIALTALVSWDVVASRDTSARDQP
jgi:hypothetical protein